MRILDHRRYYAPLDLAAPARHHVLDDVAREDVRLHAFDEILVHRVLPDVLRNRSVERIGPQLELGHVLLEASADDTGVHDDHADVEGSEFEAESFASCRDGGFGGAVKGW